MYNNYVEPQLNHREVIMYVLELRSLAEKEKVSLQAKVLFPCGQLSLETVPKRLEEAGFATTTYMHCLLVLFCLVRYFSCIDSSIAVRIFKNRDQEHCYRS